MAWANVLVLRETGGSRSSLDDSEWSPSPALFFVQFRLVYGDEKQYKLKLLDSPGVLLSRRDWVYLLSLLVPLFVYSLALKASSVAAVPGLAPDFDLMRSDVFFNLGYALFWVGLFAAVRRRWHLRRVTVVLFHVVTMLLVIVTTSAHQYFRETGTTLDYGIIALWLPQLKEVMPVLAHGTTLWAWVLLLVAVLYV